MWYSLAVALICIDKFFLFFSIFIAQLIQISEYVVHRSVILPMIKRLNSHSDRMSRDTRVPHDSRIDIDPVNETIHLNILCFEREMTENYLCLNHSWSL